MDTSRAAVRSISPAFAIPGGVVTIQGEGLPFHADRTPPILVAGRAAKVLSASSRRLRITVPAALEAGRGTITTPDLDEALGGLEVPQTLASELHLVDNPAIDRHGNVYATFSGTRGQRVPVSLFRVRPDGTRDELSSQVVNPTSLALDADGELYVSSRFDGAVYRVKPDGRVEKVASELGVACGLVFAPDRSLFVGDRTGTLFRVNVAGHVTPFASLPPSVAAFHLAIGPEEDLYVAAPTLSSSDVIYRVDRRGMVSVFASGFGRPQGLAFDAAGRLHVVEALAAASGLYRVSPSGQRDLMVSGAGLVGVAFDPRGGFVLATSDTLYRFHTDLP